MTLSAAPEIQRELLRLQELDNNLARMAADAANPPEDSKLAELAPQLNTARAAALAKRGEHEDAETELHRIESDVAVVETRVKRDSERLQHTASVKDVQALETELAALAGRRSDLEDMELEVMERIEALEAEQSALDADRARLDEQLASLEAARARRLEDVERDRSAAGADRETIAAALPAELVALYDRQRLRYGIGAARLVRGVSLGSNVALAPSDLAAVRAASPDEIVLCPDSGCILIRDEESGL